MDKSKGRSPQTIMARASLILMLLCCCVLAFLCWSVGHGFSPPTQSGANLIVDVPDDVGNLLEKELTPADVPKSLTPEPNVSEVSQLPASPSNQIEEDYGLIYQGKFDAAGELLSKINQDNSGELSATVHQLLEIIEKYKALGQQRQAARQAAYQQRLAEIEKFKTAKSPSEKARFAGNDANNLYSITDVNDANNTTELLSVIAQASELADNAQRTELLSSPFVKQVFQAVIDKAAEFEYQGKWLDAYTICYAWLQAIDPNNQAYSDYADQLIDKASIVASFQDSPCETTQERFQGVKKEIFIRAVEAMNVSYVSTIDYGKMAVEAVKRCQLLAEIMGKKPALTLAASVELQQSALSKKLSSESTEKSFSPPDSSSVASILRSTAKDELRRVDSNELNAWSAALDVVLDEIKSPELPRSGVSAEGADGFTKDRFLGIFDRILALNDATIQLPRAALIAQFAEAAFATLDPYTIIVWPKQVDDFEKMMTNEFTGIGIEISKPKGFLTVSSLLPDTPAYRSGLDAGDVIVAVDGIDTKDMSLICAVHKITGPKGTKVTLTVKRPSEETTKDITITRAKITVPTIRGWQRTESGNWLYMIDQQEKIGYVRLTGFSSDTPSELETVLNQLEKEGLKGLIMDLRFNSGGLLESAVEVADKFIKEGLIVRTQPGFGRTPTYKPAHEKGTHPNYPLVVLINSSSASASEIVAGALADKVHNRAILVGKRTHGKGSVQGITEFPGGGSQLKYTIAYYLLPSGQRVKSREEVEGSRKVGSQRQGTADWGVGPNVEIDLTNDELKKMLDVQRDNEVLVQADRSDGRTSPARHTIEESLAADPQLAVGLLIVKTKLTQERIQNTDW